MVKKSSVKKKRNDSALPQMSQCAAKYAVAIADPWSELAVGACVPTAPARPSQKLTAWKDIVATVGTSGYGFIALAPTTCNDLASVYYSGSTFAGTSLELSLDVPQTGTHSTTIGNIPYGYATQIDSVGYGRPQVMGRIVSAAISAEYIGTELNRGGNVICYVDPDHHSVNKYTFNDIISRAEADISTPDANRSKCWIGTNGTDETELDYPDPAYNAPDAEKILLSCYPYCKGIPMAPTGAIDQSRGTPIMCIIFTGTAGNTFRCKVVQHMEFIGTTADPFVSPNTTDAKGFELVQAASSLMYKKKASRPKVPLRKIMKECLKIAYKEITSPQALAKGASIIASL